MVFLKFGLLSSSIHKVVLIRIRQKKNNTTLLYYNIYDTIWFTIHLLFSSSAGPLVQLYNTYVPSTVSSLGSAIESTVMRIYYYHMRYLLFELERYELIARL